MRNDCFIYKYYCWLDFPVFLAICSSGLSCTLVMPDVCMLRDQMTKLKTWSTWSIPT